MNHLAKILLTAVLLCPLLGCQKAEKKADEKSESKSKEKKDENIITLTRENLKHLELKTEEVTLGNLGMVLKAAGHVSPNANKTAKVTSTFEGKLVKLNFDLNQKVKAGEVMGLVESPELIGRQIELKAPIDGVVVERKATAGELVDKTRDVYTISDPSQLWVIAEVKERDIGPVKIGQEGTFTVLSYPQQKFAGKVVLIANEVEAQSRTIEVRIEVENKEGRLKSGMFADIEITTTIMEGVLLIPDSALQTNGEEQIVFVMLDETKYEKRVVKLGLERDGKVQVLEGVKAGEKIATVGSFILKSEMLKGELGQE